MQHPMNADDLSVGYKPADDALADTEVMTGESTAWQDHQALFGQCHDLLGELARQLSTEIFDGRRSLRDGLLYDVDKFCAFGDKVEIDRHKIERRFLTGHLVLSECFDSRTKARSAFGRHVYNRA